MVMRHKIKRRTMGKDPIKKSTTIVNVLGQGSAAPAKLQIIVVPPRSGSGATTVIRDSQDNDNQANVGDIVKYVNICIQIGPREEQGAQTDVQNNGWLEYAVVFQREREQDMGVAQLGLHTLADVASKQYRGDCIFTGCIPVGAQQANSLDLRIKIPGNKVKLQLGSNLNLYCHMRTTDSADLRSDSHKLLMSALYKLYV